MGKKLAEQGAETLRSALKEGEDQVEQLKSDVDALKNKFSSQGGDLNKYEEEAAEAEKVAKAERERVAELERIQAQSQADELSREQNVDAAGNTLSNSQDAGASALLSEQSADRQAQSLATAAQDAKSAAATNEQGLAGDALSLENEVDLKKKSVKELEKMFEERTEKLKSERSKLSSLQQSSPASSTSTGVTAAEKNEAELAGEVEDEEAKLNELNAEKQVTELQENGAQKQIDDAKKALAGTDSELSSQADSVHTAEQKENEIKDELEEDKSKGEIAAGKTPQADELNTEAVNKADEDAALAERKLHDVQVDNADLEQKKEALTTQQDGLIEQLAASSATLHATESQLGVAKDSETDATTSMQQAQAQASTTSQQVSASQNSLNEAEAAQSSAQSSQKEAEAHLEQSKKDEAEVTKQLEKAQDDVAASSQQQQTLEQAQEQQQDVVTSLKLDVKRNEDKLAEAHNHLTEVNSRLAVARHEHEQAKAEKLKSLEQRAHLAQEVAQSAQASVTAKNEEISAMP